MIASAALAIKPTYGWLPMIERRRQADRLALELVSTGNRISDAQLHKVLDLWGFARNTKRRNVAPPGTAYVYSECFGLVYDRTGRWMVSAVAQMFPSVARLMNQWFVERLAQLSHRAFSEPLKQWKWTAITVNRGYAATRHVDLNNFGPSVIRSIADGTDRLLYWPGADRKSMSSLDTHDAVELPVSSRRHLFSFDGRCPHEVKQYGGAVESRLSVVFFLNARGWKADTSTTRHLEQLGFAPAASEEDAETFAAKFNVLSAGLNYQSWPVQTA